MDQIEDHDQKQPKKLSPLERAKIAKKKYLARPEVQERLKAQKEALKARRKKYAEKLREQRKQEKKQLAAAESSTRKNRQKAKDQMLIDALVPGSLLLAEVKDNPPSLTLIKGGLSKGKNFDP